MWWWCYHHIFSGISCFWGSRVSQKYALWVLVGCEIKFHIQQALPPEIWVKTQGYMLKIRTKKLVFFYDKYVNSTILVDSFYWNLGTNRISIKWVNHNGWIDIFVIKENYFFCSYFRPISLCVYSNSERESSLDTKFNPASN